MKILETSKLNLDRDYEIFSNGKKVGDLALYDESMQSTNINWISIDKKHRGKKYAQSVMDWIIKEETKNGKKFLTLEVPGDSSDARHIYEKKGFVAEKQISNADDVWGGLTSMKKRL